MINSKVDKVYFRKKEIFIKRDDLLDKDFSGNKARKLYYYLKNDFKDIEKIVSYGSIQSNAMYSMSVLAKIKGWEFEYIVNHIPEFLAQNPQGNYKYALQNGMKISYDRDSVDMSSAIFIEEGGRTKEASFGVEILAQEIVEFSQNRKNLVVILPSGTGTTALFLQRYLYKYNIKVYTTPCVGDKEYLIEQFNMLEEDKKFHPQILMLDKKYHFGKLYKNNYDIWLEVKRSTDIEFDLLYDPKGWLMIEQYSKFFEDKEILYIHQGGLIGNESMLARYERKYKL
ncbi:pyridoxal phosphate-dependent deaminase, putative [hydrothermal vent metagenome]|uniref:Pyridoxal phosphate-dependent deaminase, putative n=1 Tax=hydrothermal vent metagenome TaxID=652676 RepID=A0A1W1EHL5_9ZZZZ